MEAYPRLTTCVENGLPADGENDGSQPTLAHPEAGFVHQKEVRFKHINSSGSLAVSCLTDQ